LKSGPFPRISIRPYDQVRSRRSFEVGIGVYQTQLKQKEIIYVWLSSLSTETSRSGPELTIQNRLTEKLKTLIFSSRRLQCPCSWLGSVVYNTNKKLKEVKGCILVTGEIANFKATSSGWSRVCMYNHSARLKLIKAACSGSV